MRPTFARIHLGNLEHNLSLIRSKISAQSRMCVAVKADAYGHGAVVCARKALEAGADFLAVAAVSEGVELRKAGITCPVLLLSLCAPDEIGQAVENSLTPLVFDREYIRLFADEAARLGVRDFPVHLAVDTGMGRIGCYPDETGETAEIIQDTRTLSLGGVCTHFSAADSLLAADVDYTARQYDRFLLAVDNIRKRGIDPGIRHCANSAVTLCHPQMHLDMCRPGIIVYGYYPGQVDRSYFEAMGEKQFLKPVMELVSRVAAVRAFRREGCVSYGRTWTADKDTVMAILPIGYGDGLFRRMNQTPAGLKVAINGNQYPVRGRICMDQCMVELGEESGVKRWDEAVIFGPKESGAAASAQEIADATGTISYEITCGVSKRVPRIYVD